MAKSRMYASDTESTARPGKERRARVSPVVRQEELKHPNEVMGAVKVVSAEQVKDKYCLDTTW
eukprot:9402395-Alexandrium_andersonii.AAC.1